VSGKKFDIDELREILTHAARAEDGYARAKMLCKRHPAPFDAYFDAINMMGPINVLRGTREAAEFFDVAVAEFEGLVARGLGPLSEERFRTVVEGPPPYPFYRSFRNLFARWGAVAVASTYSTVGGIWEWGFRHDPRRPLESIAEQMLRENLTNRSIVARYAQIKRYVEEWEADALVIHSIKSCRLFSAGQGDMRDYFTQKLGVPTLMVESDLEDPRYYAEAQIKNRIDAFFESLEHRKLVQSA
jgi:benzoyl-CoA reductase subunit B